MDDEAVGGVIKQSNREYGSPDQLEQHANKNMSLYLEVIDRSTPDRKDVIEVKDLQVIKLTKHAYKLSKGRKNSVLCSARNGA